MASDSSGVPLLEPFRSVGVASRRPSASPSAKTTPISPSPTENDLPHSFRAEKQHPSPAPPTSRYSTQPPPSHAPSSPRRQVRDEPASGTGNPSMTSIGPANAVRLRRRRRFSHPTQRSFKIHPCREGRPLRSSPTGSRPLSPKRERQPTTRTSACGEGRRSSSSTWAQSGGRAVHPPGARAAR
jgi:hypothetical protein